MPTRAREPADARQPRPPPVRRRAAARRLAPLLLASSVLLACQRGPPEPVPPPAPPAPAETAPAPSELRIHALRGKVERSTGPGSWTPVVEGELLRAEDSVRAAPGASAEIAVGAHGRVLLADRTELGVRELTDAVHRFRLSRGIVTVDYQADGHRVVRIEAPSGRAVVESKGARFHVSANGLVFAVASRTGTVALSSAGGQVTVGPGEWSIVSGDGAPAPARAIPTDLLLKVAQASRVGEPGRCLDRVGRSEPGARAIVDGAEVAVGGDGRFPIRVAARRKEDVVVRVISADGREAVRRVPCDPEAAPRIRDLRVRWRTDAQ